MKEDFWAKRAREEEENKRKYNKACGEWAKEYGFEFTDSHRSVIFRRTSSDKDMLYTIERWSRMAVATVLQISSRRLGLWLKERDSFSNRDNTRRNNTREHHGCGTIYSSIFRYDSDYGFHPENVEEYLDEIKLECFPVLERYKDKDAIIEHIKNNGPDYDLWPWSLDYMLCSAEKEDLESFLISHFKTSDKSKIKDGIIAEISDERHNSYWITELTEKGVL
jgi:hypothetical protein